ncbi:MAG: flagellar basal body rod protein FlgC [Pseudomonadota bacterium]
MSLGSIFDIAGSAMSAQSVRLNTTASNMANADSAAGSAEEAYRARYPVFSSVQAQALQGGFQPQGMSGMGDAESAVRIDGIVESDRPVEGRYEPGHPLADENGQVFYPNVDVVEEMSNMISSSRSFQMNVDVMNAARSMMQRVLSMGQ